MSPSNYVIFFYHTILLEHLLLYAFDLTKKQKYYEHFRQES